MLIYLPERIYNRISNDKKFLSLVSDLVSKVTDSANSLSELLDNENNIIEEDFQNIFTTIKDILKNEPNLIQEFNYIALDIQETGEEVLDVENRLILLENGIDAVYADLHGQEDLYYELVDQYLALFNGNLSFRFSELIYSNAFKFTMLSYLRELELSFASSKTLNFKEIIDTFRAKMQLVYKFSLQFLCNYNYLNNKLIFQKKLIIVELFKLLKRTEFKNKADFDYGYYMSKIFLEEKFKYEFNYPDFLFFHELLIHYLDDRNFPELLRVLDIQMGFIQFAEENPKEAYKSLIYHSDSFTPNFLALVSFYKILTDKYLTSYPKKVNMVIDEDEEYLDYLDAIYETLDFLNLFLKDKEVSENGKTDN